ncbi:EamA family transporter [Leucobacter aridicollis]|uniref:Inner membrane transporter RhtA n=1 Tax=Leucobacter aridicollis TaxID=283878 RepID=A0A852RHR7_9MICO|nr:EamA family transporter [Leucobacter aridicollis]NYD28400.1 inner membrane transporter RhtA [Leucobacter aridicollis]
MTTQRIHLQAGSPEPAGRSALGRGVGLTQIASLGNQLGAATGALAFPAIGPVGVVAVRQLVAAAVLMPVGRPNFRALKRADWLAVTALALVFSIMNTSVYLTIERLGLGLAITLEFLGPLALVILSARRVIDLVGGLVAVMGVVVLVNPGTTSDILGVAIGLVSAAAWAAYILLNRRLGRTLPGMQGTATASLISGIIWIPIAITWFTAHPPPLWALGFAVICALASSVLPFSIDVVALRLLPASLFSTLQSMHPVWAALVGFMMLGQRLSATELIGIGLVVASNVLVTSTNAVRARR